MNENTRIICEKVKIKDYVGRHVQLKAKGNGEYLGLCPMHGEKTPSFTLNEQKGFFYCFGCQAKGNVISFAMQFHQLSFKDAVKKIAEEYSLELPEQQEYNGKQSQYKQLLIHGEIYGFAAAIYQKNLQKYPKIIEYLEKRGLNQESMAEFGLGYAEKSSENLIRGLLKDFSPYQIQQSKLLYRNREGGQWFNPFAGRISFPIRDAGGTVIAFGGRALRDVDQPKYLNSAENAFFNKKKQLYALDIVKKKVKTAHKSSSYGGRLLLVEGYLDAILSNQAGVPAVAVLGSSISLEQLQLAWNYSGKPTLALDNDIAGQRATLAVIDRLAPHLTPEYSCDLLCLSQCKDAGEAIQRFGPKQWLEMVDKCTQALPDFLFANRRQQVNMASPDGRAKFRLLLQQDARKFQDAILRSEYMRYFNERYFNLLKVERQQDSQHNKAAALNSSARNFNDRRSAQNAPWSAAKQEVLLPTKKVNVANNILDSIPIYIVNFLKSILKNPELLNNTSIKNALSSLECEDSDANFMRHAMLNLSDSGKLIEASEGQAKKIIEYLVNTHYNETESSQKQLKHFKEKLEILCDYSNFTSALPDSAEKIANYTLKMQEIAITKQKIAKVAQILTGKSDLTSEEYDHYEKKLIDLKKYEAEIKKSLLIN